MASKSRKTKRESPPQTQDSSDDALSRARIAAAAVALLDEQGLNGLTMRRLAEQLGSGVMSLYWHVKNKEEVLALALDSILEYRPPQLADPQAWRAQVLHLLEDWRVIMLRHPWSASLLPRQALGQNILGRLELLGQALSSAGVADEELNAAIWSLWNYVMGATITRSSFDHAAKENAASSDQASASSGQHPTIERTGLLLDDDWDGVFVRGLGFLLDGLISKRSTSSSL